MRVLYISEVQWLSQVSRKHQFVRRFPDDWDVLFLSPANATSEENSFRERTDAVRPNVRYASLPLPKPDSKLGAVRALTGVLSHTGTRAVLSRARSFRPDVVVCSYIWAASMVPLLKDLGIPVVYDCNDLHPQFYPAFPEEAESLFRSLVGSASEVVSSSERLREVCGRGAVVGNGVDLETFTGRIDCPPPAVIMNSRLGDCAELAAYVGSVDDRIDFGILKTLAASMSSSVTRRGILCIGRVFEGVREETEALTREHGDHILFTGRVPYDELPAYMSHASVGIAPFVLDERTRAINPNKLYMYAAMEQNIVSTPFSADITEHGDIVFVADGVDSFTRSVEAAFGDDERRRTIRDRIAVPNGWNEKALAFMDILLQITSEGRREA